MISDMDLTGKAPSKDGIIDEYSIDFILCIHVFTDSHKIAKVSVYRCQITHTAGTQSNERTGARGESGTFLLDFPGCQILSSVMVG